MPPIIRTDVTFIQISQSSSSVHIHSLLSHLPRCFLRRLGGAGRHCDCGSDSMWHLNTCRHRERVGKQMAARCSRKDLMPELCVTEAFLRVAWLWHQACGDKHTNWYIQKTHKQSRRARPQTRTDTVWQLRHHSGLLPSSVPLERRWWSCAVERRGVKLSRANDVRTDNLVPVGTFYLGASLQPHTTQAHCLSKLKWSQTKKEQIVWGLLILTFKRKNGASFILNLCCKSLFLHYVQQLQLLPTLTDFGETGSYFMENMSSDVLWLLCLSSLWFTESPHGRSSICC